MGLVLFRKSDGLNNQVVDAAHPLPTTTGASVDSTGLPLPANFESLQRNFTRNGTGSIATEYRSDGVNTWTQTYTRDGSDNITVVSKWVKS